MEQLAGTALKKPPPHIPREQLNLMNEVLPGLRHLLPLKGVAAGFFCPIMPDKLPLHLRQKVIRQSILLRLKCRSVRCDTLQQ